MWLRIFISVLLVVSCSSSQQYRNLTFYNAGDQKVMLDSVKGLSLYDGRGPSKFGDTILHPKTPSGMFTSTPIKVSYPIEVVYRLNELEKGRTQNIQKIENLAINQETIDESGTLLLLYKEGKFTLIFFEGVSSFTKTELESKFVNVLSDR